MVKKIEIAVMIEDSGKIVTLIKKNGYKIDSVGDHLELIGLFENLKLIQLENLRTFINAKR